MIAERTTRDLALSDLIISRVRSHFGFDFISAESTPLGLINDAYLSSIDRSLLLYFAPTPIEHLPQSCRANRMHVSLYPHEQVDWTEFTSIVDRAVVDIDTVDAPESHISRLVLLFNYNQQRHVSSDLRHEFFADLFDRFPGILSYVDPKSYRMPIQIDEWNIHPSGMPIAWEGEFVFDERTPLDELERSVQQIYGIKPSRNWPIHLPIRELQGVPCRFTMTPRFF